MRDDDGTSPLALHIVPLCRNSAERPPNKEQSVTGFVIVDGQQALSERISSFADLFALTAGEGRVEVARAVWIVAVGATPGV